MTTVRVVVVDNYDSFTYNLQQALLELGADSLVVKNDVVTADELRELQPDRIVVSPGPGRPERAEDFGVSRAVIEDLSATIPTLGVCLGHQGLAAFGGGRVVHAPQVMHGKTSWVRHFGGHPFEDLPEEFEVMRYHSLVVERSSLPEHFEVTAETCDDALIMGLRHKQRPAYGLQFHPESVGTALGKIILQRFLRGP